MAKKVPNFDNESGGGGNSPSNPNEGQSKFMQWFKKPLFYLGDIPVSQGPIVGFGIFVLVFIIGNQ